MCPLNPTGNIWDIDVPGILGFDVPLSLCCSEQEFSFGLLFDFITKHEDNQIGTDKLSN